MNFNCTQCGQSLELDDQHAGRDFQCPACGRYIQAPGQRTEPLPMPPSLQQPSQPAQRATYRQPPLNVHVVDIKMPCGSMVMFMIKWALASIPALIILLLLYVVFVGTLLGGCMATMMNMK